MIMGKKGLKEELVTTPQQPGADPLFGAEAIEDLQAPEDTQQQIAGGVSEIVVTKDQDSGSGSLCASGKTGTWVGHEIFDVPCVDSPGGPGRGLRRATAQPSNCWACR